MVDSDSDSDNIVIMNTISSRGSKTLDLLPHASMAHIDPEFDWIPRRAGDISSQRDNTLHDQKLGHVDPCTYFGNNFSPLTSFTDDTESNRNVEDDILIPSAYLPSQQMRYPSIDTSSSAKSMLNPSQMMMTPLEYPRLFDPLSVSKPIQSLQEESLSKLLGCSSYP
jgi:hypothetical protein